MSSKLAVKNSSLSPKRKFQISSIWNSDDLRNPTFEYRMIKPPVVQSIIYSTSENYLILGFLYLNDGEIESQNRNSVVLQNWISLNLSEHDEIDFQKYYKICPKSTKIFQNP